MSRSILCVASVLLATGLARAGTVGVSNLGETPGGSGWGVKPTSWVAMSFTVGAGAWMLDSVDMRLWDVVGVSVSFGATLHADAAGLPGASIVGLAGPDPGAEAVYNYTPTAATALSASTTYWVVAGATVGPDFLGWSNTNSSAQAGLPGWSIMDGLAYSTNFGATWMALPGQAPAMFGVNVSDANGIPLPGAAWTGLAGVLALGAIRRRRAG